MILISVLGLDQFVVGHYSKEHTSNLAELFETDTDDINFYAPSSMIFHNGVEQTSWNTVVKVMAECQYRAVENNVAEYLMKTLSEFSINVQVVFEYYEEENSYEKINEEYPRYITESNIVKTEEEEEDDCCDDDDCSEADPRDRAELDIDNPDDIYLGNAFEGFEEKLKGNNK